MTGIYGLVVCGGQSSRMGSDKSLLDYHGQPQYKWVYQLLQSLCENVYIGCNEIQALQISDQYPTITDAPQYQHIGPMAAILSAFEAYPQAMFLVAGCDYPFITQHALARLTDQYKGKTSTYYNEASGLYEPLLGMYTPDIHPLLTTGFREGNYSLQYILKKMGAQKITPASPDVIESIDTPAAFADAKQRIEKLNTGKL